ncbi:MAG: hypothetical protein OEZ65_00275 [Gemmatimonadota bacterium]|nr:hypothetical protein [Gemmatimonadota bacterium]
MRKDPVHPGRVFAWVTVLSALLAPAAAAQEVNSSAALDLVRRGRDLRRSSVQDSTFGRYSARATGNVYFLLDRPDTDERTLVKADQVALDIYWRAPNRTHQRIVGLRDRKTLPTNIHYHLDHLTVVQDDFGDRIRLGDGDEVSSVPHPLAPGAESVYDYTLTDSLTVGYGSSGEIVRVYEIEVRPREMDQPGFLGSIYLDRASAAVVRMRFTFTPASYMDRRLDYIRISLDNSLWMGRHWLPYRQEVEIRREIPALDFVAGSVIQGHYEIRGYDFDTPAPDRFFLGPAVSMAPQHERDAFAFSEELLAGVEGGGLSTPEALVEVRARLSDVARRRYLSGLNPHRLYFERASEVIRYDRAEGLHLGGGVRFQPAPTLVARLTGGYAFGAGDPSGRVSLVHAGATGPQATLTASWNRMRDMGPHPGASPSVNTLSSVLLRQDFLDPYFVRGLELSLAGSGRARSPRLTVRWEQHASARTWMADPGSFRPLAPVDEGRLTALDGRLPVHLPGGGKGDLSATLGRMEGRATFRTAEARASWAHASLEGGWSLRGDVSGGIAGGGVPAQALFLLGGRNTLPGHPYRGSVGDAYWLVRGEAGIPVAGPWVGLRTFAALGRTHLRAHEPPAGWTSVPARGVSASVGGGVALGWDVLRMDVARGLGAGGGWEARFTVNPRFHPWL